MTPNATAPDTIEITTTYLEMFACPAHLNLTPPRDDLQVMRAVQPTVSFYRYLYDTVGEPWLWYERRQMAPEALRAIIQHPQIEVYVLYVAGVPAGYAELDRTQPGQIELAYFGLLPAFIGQRLGRYLLHWAIATAWSHAPRRLWVHTCTLDHPNALPVYQKAGFVPYDRKTEQIPRPAM